MSTASRAIADPSAAPTPIERRGLVACGLAALGTAGVLPRAAAAQAVTPSRVMGHEDRYVALANPTTREYTLAWHVRGGMPHPAEEAKLDWILRDWRESQAVRMDRRLYDLLFVVQQAFRSPYPIVVNSGYRTPRTNGMLGERFPGVAQNSFHLHGMAVDVWIPGVEPRAVFELVAALGVGGCGHYPSFTHIDVGPARWWSGEANQMGAWRRRS